MGGSASVPRRITAGFAALDLVATKTPAPQVEAGAAAEPAAGTAADAPAAVPAVLEGVEEVICRMCVLYDSNIEGRWDKITKKVNRELRRRQIPSDTVHAALDAHGLCIPVTWRLEMEQRERDRAAAEKLRQEQEALRAAEAAQAAQAAETAGRPASPTTKSLTTAGSRLKDASSPRPTSPTAKSPKSGAPPPKSLSAAQGKSAKGGAALAPSSEPLLPGGGDSDGEEDDYADAPVEPGGFVMLPLDRYQVFSYMHTLHHHAWDILGANASTAERTKTCADAVQQLYASYTPEMLKRMSQDNRKKLRLGSPSLAYGEVGVEDFVRFLQKMQRIHGHMCGKGGSFWDLGCGVGKAVLAAAILHSFDSCCGAEVLPDLTRVASGKLRSYREDVLPSLTPAQAKTDIQIITADVLQQQWSKKATVVLVHGNYTAKETEQIRQQVDKMRVGSLCMSVSIPLVTEQCWGLLGREELTTSWGKATIYAHEKLCS